MLIVVEQKAGGRRQELVDERLDPLPTAGRPVKIQIKEIGMPRTHIQDDPPRSLSQIYRNHKNRKVKP